MPARPRDVRASVSLTMRSGSFSHRSALPSEIATVDRESPRRSRSGRRRRAETRSRRRRPRACPSVRAGFARRSRGGATPRACRSSPSRCSRARRRSRGSPRPASSFESAFASWATPPFDAAYAETLKPPWNDIIEASRTIEPPPPSTIRRAAAWASSKTELRLRSMTCRQSSSVVSRNALADDHARVADECVDALEPLDDCRRGARLAEVDAGRALGRLDMPAVAPQARRRGGADPAARPGDERDPLAVLRRHGQRSTCSDPPRSPRTRSRSRSPMWSSGTGERASMKVTPLVE